MEHVSCSKSTCLALTYKEKKIGISSKRIRARKQSKIPLRRYLGEIMYMHGGVFMDLGVILKRCSKANFAKLKDLQNIALSGQALILAQTGRMK